jgi:hypothetical protein
MTTASGNLGRDEQTSETGTDDHYIRMLAHS